MPKKSLLALIKDPDIGGRIFMVLAVIGVLVAAILLSGPKPVEYVDPTTVTQAASSDVNSEMVQTPEPMVDESRTEYPVTTGIILGAVAVLLIIEVGTLLELKRNSKNNH
jgi:hypothetical protein